MINHADHIANAAAPRGVRSLLRRIPWSDAASRIFWLAMLAIHAPALAGVMASLAEHGGSTSSLAGFLALLAACGIFILKACGQRLLPEGGRSQTIVLWTVVAMVHRGALPPAERQALDNVATLGVATAVLVGGAALGAKGGRRAFRRLAARLRDALAAAHANRLAAPRIARAEPARAALPPAILCRSSAPRGPPSAR